MSDKRAINANVFIIWDKERELWKIGYEPIEGQPIFQTTIDVNDVLKMFTESSLMLCRYIRQWREDQSDDEFEEDDDLLFTDDCCPYCGAVWGMDELDRERCASCGWVVGTLYEGDDDE